MDIYRVVLCNIVDGPTESSTGSVFVTAPSKEAAEAKALVSDYETMDWLDEYGEQIKFKDVAGQIVVVPSETEKVDEI